MSEPLATTDDVATALRAARQSAGLTQAELAERTGLHPSVVSKYESGRRQPSGRALLQLLHAAGADLSDTRSPSNGTDDDPADETDSRGAAIEGPNDRHDGLRAAVLVHLRKQGFKVSEQGVLGPVESDKNRLRELHLEAVAAQRARARGTLERYENRFVARLANGVDVAPSDIRPRLVPILDRRSFDGLLWRWCSLHWSVPVSSGYGRRLRFLVVDEMHDDAVIGLIGLGDPVFALGCRDAAVGWSAQARTERLACVMDAFVLGAVPPYSHLLGGKLMALLAGSAEVQVAFAERYGHRETLISQRDPQARLALITTSSALGRSSVYNRLRRVDGTLALEPTGYTLGTGDFHFSGEIYDRLAAYAAAIDPGKGSHRHERWGSPGFRNRREVLQVALEGLGFDSRALRSHGVKRQVFLQRLGTNTDRYLRGEDADLEPRSGASVFDLSAWWRERWAQPRSRRDCSWLTADRTAWRLYV